MEQWMGTTGVMAITAVAYLVGEAVKLTPLPARFIPVLCMAVGGVLGVPAMHLLADYPAADPLTAVAVGIVSGWAATGLHQTLKQMTGGKEG